MDADALVARLADDLRPVRRVARPGIRLGAWLLVSAPAAAVVVWWHGLRPDFGAQLTNPAFVAGAGAALLTALVAGYAALCAGLPDQPGWKLWAPWGAAALWLATLGQQCWAAWALFGTDALAPGYDPMCIPAIAMGALVPAVAIVALLRRATAVRQGLAGLFGALAAGALAAFALRFYHAEDAAMMVLVWQLGSVALFTAAAAGLGRLVARGVGRKVSAG